MSVKQYLINKQPIVYNVLKNSFLRNKTLHAYIVSGSKGAPILDVAYFMVKSFVCQNKDENNLACEQCINCKKIDNNGYVDFEFINGEDLKKGVIDSLQENFSKSAVEQAGIKIYIIHLIEKAPVASLNKLLKFIEEPSSNIVAIFTSNSVNSTLQTIVSRCQIISLREFMIKDLVDFLMSNNVSSDDANLLCKISNDAEKNLEIVKSDSYITIKQALVNSLNYLAKKDDMFIVYMQVENKDLLADNKQSDLYLDMLEVCLLEAIICKEDESYEPPFFANVIKEIAKNYDHIDHMISLLTNAKIELLSYANSNLVFDKLLISLTMN